MKLVDKEKTNKDKEKVNKEVKIDLDDKYKLEREIKERIELLAAGKKYVFLLDFPFVGLFAFKRGEDWYAVKINNIFFFVERPPKFLDDRVEVVAREFTPEKNKIKLIFIFK